MCFALCITKEEQTFSLFTTNGARIVEKDDWTLGDCLHKLHKSDARFGIGELSSDDLPSPVYVYKFKSYYIAYILRIDLYL